MRQMETPPVRILYAIASLRGGAAKHVLYLLEHFKERGFHSTLLVPNDHPATAEKVSSLGIDWKRMSFAYSSLPSALRTIRSTLAGCRPQIVHSHGIRAAWFVRRVLAPTEERKYACVYTVHGFHPAHYRNPLKRLFALRDEKRLFEKATDRAIFVSNADRELFRQSLKLPEESISEKCRVIPNGIRFIDRSGLPDKKEARRKLGLRENNWIIGTLSRLYPQKAVHLLIDAANQLKGKIPGLQIAIVGDGPLRAKLQRQIDREGLQDVVYLLGYRDDVLNVYAALDIFVLTSLWEGLPLVLLEAAGLGIPIVATDIPGNRDIINSEKNGLLFESGNVKQLTGQILRLYREDGLSVELAETALQKVKDRFSLEKMLEQTGKVYDNLLNDMNG